MTDLDILTREEWGATLSPGPARPGAITEIWIHHTVTLADDNNSVADISDVISDMLELEKVGASRFGRFPYSFCFHPSGVVAEGGGWDTVGAHTENHNSVGLGLAAIGNFDVNIVPLSIKERIADLILLGIKLGKLPPFDNFPTGGHRDTKQTACPGIFLYNEIPWIKNRVTNPPNQTSILRGSDSNMIYTAPDGSLRRLGIAPNHEVFHQIVAKGANPKDSTWVSLGGWAATVSGTFDGNGREIVSAHGSDNKLYHRIFTPNQGWGGWEVNNHGMFIPHGYV